MIYALNVSTVLGLLLSGLLMILYCGARPLRKAFYISLVASFAWLTAFDIRFYSGDDPCVIGAPVKALVNRALIDLGMLCAILDAWRGKP